MMGQGFGFGGNGMMNGVVNGVTGGGNQIGMGNFGWFQGFSFPMLIVIGIAILAFILIFKNKKQPAKKQPIFSNETSPALSAAEVIRLRYARGEITFDEYQSILKNVQ